METEVLSQLAINSNEVTVRALAIEKLRASYENRVMQLEATLYGLPHSESKHSSRDHAHRAVQPCLPYLSPHLVLAFSPALAPHSVLAFTPDLAPPPVLAFSRCPSPTPCPCLLT